MKFKYQVQQKVGQEWVTKYDGDNHFHSYNVAGGHITIDPGKPVRILEMLMENGRLRGQLEFGANPPAWSGNKEITPRAFEVFIREPIGDSREEYIKKSKMLKHISGDSD